MPDSSIVTPSGAACGQTGGPVSSGSSDPCRFLDDPDFPGAHGVCGDGLVAFRRLVLTGTEALRRAAVPSRPGRWFNLVRRAWT